MGSGTMPNTADLGEDGEDASLLPRGSSSLRLAFITLDFFEIVIVL